jgi:hypothetical protein
MFQKMYGVGSENTYTSAPPWNLSRSRSWTTTVGDKKLGEVVGEDHIQLLMRSRDSAVESYKGYLFAFGAKISYVPDSWITSSPGLLGEEVEGLVTAVCRRRGSSARMASSLFTFEASWMQRLIFLSCFHRLAALSSNPVDLTQAAEPDRPPGPVFAWVPA